MFCSCRTGVVRAREVTLLEAVETEKCQVSTTVQWRAVIPTGPVDVWLFETHGVFLFQFASQLNNLSSWSIKLIACQTSLLFIEMKMTVAQIIVTFMYYIHVLLTPWAHYYCQSILNQYNWTVNSSACVACLETIN